VKANDEIKNEIKRLLASKVEFMTASVASSNDLDEMFSTLEIDANSFVAAYEKKNNFDEVVLGRIYADLKSFTKNAMKVIEEKGKDLNEVPHIQTLSFDFLSKLTSHTLPAMSYDVKRNGPFKTSEVASETSNKVVRFNGQFDEVVLAKGMSLPVFAMEDKNPRSETILKKSIAQGVIQVCGIYHALSLFDCAPMRVYSCIHNVLGWIVVVRRIAKSGDEQYVYTRPVKCIIKKDISEDGLNMVSRLLYIAMRNTENILLAVAERQEHLFTNQPSHVSEVNEDSDGDEDDDDDDAGPHGDITDALATLVDLKVSSGQNSTQQEKQKTSTAKTKSTAGRDTKKSSRPLQFLQLTAKNLLLAPAMC
jgi:hypothetical protein